MKRFTIAELESFSGIKAHTFRTWEQRYTLLIPQRTKSNFRFYTLDDINYLLNIALLNKAGISISNIAKLDSSAMRQQVAAITDGEIKKEKELNKLIISMYTGDTEDFEMVLDNCVLSWGIDHTINDIIITFLERVNLLSYSDTSIETHFVVTAIRKKIILGIEKITVTKKNKKAVMLFLPKSVHYDLILLYLEYKLKCLAFKTFYLGTNISIKNLSMVADQKQPDYLVTYLPPGSHLKYDEYIDFLQKNFPQKGFVITPESSVISKKEMSAGNEAVQYKKIDEFLSQYN